MAQSIHTHCNTFNCSTQPSYEGVARSGIHRRSVRDRDLTARGMGVRSNRYAMIVDHGVVKGVYVEAPGKFEVSSAEAVLAHL